MPQELLWVSTNSCGSLAPPS